MIGRTRLRTREKAYSVRWYRIGSRDARLDADHRVHDAPFAGSAEDEWTVVRLGRDYGCVLDANDPVDVPEELRPEALFSG